MGLLVEAACCFFLPPIGSFEHLLLTLLFHICLCLWKGRCRTSESRRKVKWGEGNEAFALINRCNAFKFRQQQYSREQTLAHRGTV